MIKRCRMDVESLVKQPKISGQVISPIANDFKANLAEFVRSTNVNLGLESITLRDIDVRRYFFNGTSNFKVFLSHSSKDKDTVYKFASFLKQQGINAFVDSMVWDNYKDLFNEFAKGCKEQEKLNIAAHLHMILASSLTYMISACDCFIFLASENSISNGNYTFSPWIYHELLTASIIPISSQHLTLALESAQINFQYSLNDIIHKFDKQEFGDIVSWIENKTMSN